MRGLNRAPLNKLFQIQIKKNRKEGLRKSEKRQGKAEMRKRTKIGSNDFTIVRIEFSPLVFTNVSNGHYHTLETTTNMTS